MIITLKTDVDRYGSIAERWPDMIVLNGTPDPESDRWMDKQS